PELAWNGRDLRGSGEADPVAGPLVALLPGPRAVTLPELVFGYRFDTPEADPAFDDYNWTLVDHLASANASANGATPVLGADEYGFHYGQVWYRGHFTATGTESSLFLNATTGNSTGQYAAWLNGAYLGTGNGGTVFPIASSALRSG